MKTIVVTLDKEHPDGEAIFGQARSSKPAGWWRFRQRRYMVLEEMHYIKKLLIIYMRPREDRPTTH